MNAFQLPRLHANLPHLYFAFIFLFMAVTSGSIYPAFVAVPFLIQIYFQNKIANLFMAIVISGYSIWFSLAVLSDILNSKFITSPFNLTRAITFVVANYVMSIQLFKEAKERPASETL